MTIHIKRVVAAMAALLTLLTLVPTAALPTIQLPALSEQSVETTVPEDNAGTDAPAANNAGTDAPAANNAGTDAPAANNAGTDAPAANNAGTDAPAANNAVADAPSTAPDASVDNAEEPEVVYGPVTSEDVLTSDDGMVLDEDGTLYVDSDNDGAIEEVKGDVIEDDEDFDTSDLFAEMAESVTVGKDVEPTVNVREDSEASVEYLAVSQSASGVDLTTGYYENAYEPSNTDNEDHPFLPNGTAWIDLSKIKYGAPASPTYPFTKWSANTSFLNTSATEYDSEGRATAWLFPDKNLINDTIWSSQNYESTATSSVSGTTGYVYNRYDSMQGKWGITLDKNVSYVEFSVGSANYNVNLSDTPYLTYSTEQEDGNKLLIAVRIGTPTAWNSSGTATDWEYRWYTITDNNERPELDVDTMMRSMEPEVQISLLDAETPILNEYGYVDGATTGCIDMTHWLPFVNPTTMRDASDLFRVDKVRIYKDGDKAARVNYLYFLNQSSIMISPQTLLTADIDLSADQEILADSATTIDKARDTDTSSDDQNGWKNAAAFNEYSVTANSYSGDVTTTSASNFDTVTSGSKNYVTVIIPVRKWVNVALDARRLHFSVAGSSIAAANRPVFSIYGNSTGHADPDRNASDGISLTDNLLGVFGGKADDGTGLPYLAHSTSKIVSPGHIDEDFAYNLDYSSKSNWFDLLDSRYIRKHMVQSGDRAGWIYITEIHIVVPAASGITFDLGQFTLANNSDSLNASHIVGAFDGGTGVQPQTDVSSGQSVTNKAAAFGPLLDTSNFGTFDLLERVSDDGGATQAFYGRVYKTTAATSYGWSPVNVNNGKIIDTIPSGTYVKVYATCTYNYMTWGLIGSSSSSAVWAPMTDMEQVSTKGEVYSAGAWSSTSEILDAFANDNWLLSGFNEWGAANSSKITDAGVYYTAPDGDWLTDTWGHNGSTPIGGSYLRWGKNNDYQESDTAIGIYSHIGMTRTVKNPLTLQNLSDNGYTGRAPMLRYHIAHSGGEIIAALTVEIDGTNVYYYLSPNSDGTISLSTSSASFSADTTYQGYLSLQSLVDAGTTVKVVALSVHATSTSYLTFKNFEILYEREGSRYQWYDELNTTTNEDGETIVIDNVDIISDAFHYGIADGTDSLTGSGKNLVGNYGERGWKIGSYNLDTAGSGAVSVSDYIIEYPQYRPSLDHLRIPIEAGNTGQFVFQADRSFPISNFKYLYVSYSVADDDGVAAADDSGTGISMAIHEVQDATKGYYMAVDSNGDPTQLTYASSVSTTAYSSCVNAAIDLSTLSGLTSINEIIFYMNNTTSATTDFYINYLFLSNVQPSEAYRTIANTPYYHNYYLMDGSGDRYSCRFPTTDNPTGRVSSDDLRVNPLIIERGDVFYEGTYYNGVPLSSVCNSDGTTNSSYATASDKALAAVWFYQYDNDTLGETWGIDDFYKISDETITFNSNLTGSSVTFDALWCYNRWLTGWGLQRYVGYDESTGAVDGSLLELYATTNNVLLRTGLEPITYQTIYNTHGGQMTYPGSMDINDTTDGLIENENNYYITNTVVLSYYVWPTEMNQPNVVVNPVKYGYVFNGWYTAETGGTRIYRYNTKQLPEDITLHAQWSADPDYDDVVNTVTFTAIDESTEWFTRAAKRDNEFVITIPTVTMINDGSGGKVNLVGWTVKGDTSGKIYTPGMKLTVTKKTTLIPYTNTNDDVTVSITLAGGAKLYLYKGEDVTPTLITNGLMGIKVSGTTYSNIPRYTVLVAKPTTASSSKTWQINDSSGSAYMVADMTRGTTVTTEVSTNYKQYTFAANETMTLTYASALTNRLSYNAGAVVWTSPKVYNKNRQLMFYTQFELPEGAEFVSCGTMYTKDSQVGNLDGWSDSSATAQATAFYVDMVFVNGVVGTANGGSAIRYVEATKTNDTNQYYLMVTENKGKEVTYYARGYVEFMLNGETNIAYSSVVSSATIEALA